MGYQTSQNGEYVPFNTYQSRALKTPEVVPLHFYTGLVVRKSILLSIETLSTFLQHLPQLYFQSNTKYS